MLSKWRTTIKTTIIIVRKNSFVQLDVYSNLEAQFVLIVNVFTALTYPLEPPRRETIS